MPMRPFFMYFTKNADEILVAQASWNDGADHQDTPRRIDNISSLGNYVREISDLLHVDSEDDIAVES